MATKEASVSFEPKNAEELGRFFEANKNKYNEIWIILTNKYADPQPVTFNGVVNEAVKQGFNRQPQQELERREICGSFHEEKNQEVVLALVRKF